MKRPKKKDYNYVDIHDINTQYSKAQDLYIDYLLDGIQKALAKLIRASP